MWMTGASGRKLRVSCSSSKSTFSGFIIFIFVFILFVSLLDLTLIWKGGCLFNVIDYSMYCS